jgi:biopolymer transport protein ExbB
MYWFDSAYEAVARFMDMGGNVLWLIAILLFFMWALIFERVWYFKTGWKRDVAGVISVWEGRS